MLGTGGWVVGLVSVSFERVTLEERGLGLLLLGRGISRTLALFGRSNQRPRPEFDLSYLDCVVIKYSCLRPTASVPRGKKIFKAILQE